jgi:hypothetical protein
MSQGVLYVCYGSKAEKEARLSRSSLTTYHDWSVLAVSDKRQAWAKTLLFEGKGKAGREAKVSLDKLSPWKDTLFLDADTRVWGDLSIGFRLLEQGWEFVMVPSDAQFQDFANASNEERGETMIELPLEPLTLNTGVMWFRKTARVKRFFAEWRRQWKRWQGVDQAAFARALELRPMALFVLGWPYNAAGSGTVVHHRFGAAGR